MRIIFSLTLYLLLCSAPSSARSYPDFKRQNFELSTALGLDYRLVLRKYDAPSTAKFIEQINKPYAGFSFGFQYTYRPFAYFGMSTGLETMVYGYHIGPIIYSPGVYNPYLPPDQYMAYGTGFQGLMGVPFLLHVYGPITNTTIELIIGPEFFFGIYDISNTSNFKTTDYYSRPKIKQTSSLAWDVQLLGNFCITKVFSVSAGPEWKFLDLKQLTAGNEVNYSTPRPVPFSLGLKVALCFGSNFWKKQKAPKD